MGQEGGAGPAVPQTGEMRRRRGRSVCIFVVLPPLLPSVSASTQPSALFLVLQHSIWVFSAGELTQLVAQSEHLYDDGYQNYISCLDLSRVFCADVSNCLYQSGFNQRGKTNYSCLSLPSPNIHIDFSHTFSSLD